MKWFKLIKDYDGKKKDEVVQLSEADGKKLVDAGIAEETTVDPIKEATEALRLSMEKTVADTVQKTVADALKSVKTGDGKALRIDVSPKGDDGDDSTADKKRGWKGAGEFYHAISEVGTIAHASRHPKLAKYVEQETNRQKAISGQGELVGEDGGVLVPPDFSTQIFNKAMAPGNLLGMTTAFSVAGNSLELRAVKENSRADGSRYGGITSAWLDEGQQLSFSKAKLTPLSLKLRKLGVLLAATGEMLSDVNFIEQFLTQLAGDEINFKVSDAIFRGDGLGKPKGIINLDCAKQVSKVSSQTADTINADNIDAMWMSMPPWLRSQAVWFINSELEAQLQQLHYKMIIKNAAGSENVGGSAIPLYVPPGGLASAPNGQIKGRPVMPLEYCSAIGDVGDIVLAHMPSYLTIFKGGIQSAVSMHLRFDYDETAFRFLFRVDGNCWWPSALTPYKGAVTQSPFNYLEAR